MSPGQDSNLPSTTKKPRQDPVGHASTPRQSRAPEGFDAKGAAKSPPETPGSSERANQHLSSESEQRNQGGGTEPQRLTGNEQQPQGPRRSDASVEMVVLSPDLSMNPTTARTMTQAVAGDADPERSESGSEVTESAVKSSLISDSVMDSGFVGPSRSDATEAKVERQGESHLLIILPVSRQTEESPISGAAEDLKPHQDPDLTVPNPSLQSRNTEGDMINVSAIEIKETQTMFDRRDAVSPKPQTSPQCADAGEVEVEDVHTHTVLEKQHYDNVTLVFKNSTQPSSDLSSDSMTGNAFFQSKSKSTRQTVLSVYQPPTDTVTRKAAKLRPGVRGQRVRF